MSTSTGAAILGRVIMPDEPTLHPEAARSLLKLTFDERDRRRVEELTARNQEGLLTEGEREEFDDYIRVNDLLSLLKIKARLSPRQAGSSP